MSEFIPYGRQNISQEDIDAVVDVLRSDFLTQGPKVPEFEKSIVEACDVKYAYAMNSATSALHVACLALGIGPGDIVWTTPITFVASSNCALYCGATVDFVDIDDRTYNLSPVALKEKLEKAKKDNKLPKLVIPVHLCGQPCEMEEIRKLSKEYGFYVVEDASHAIGGKYQEKPIGNCEYSDMTVFSFHPVKIVTTAEGGVLVTNNADLAKKIELFRSHGITRDEELLLKKDEGAWYYEQKELGYNYRMTELQAALGVSQMRNLHEITAKRHLIANRYDELLKDLPVITPYNIEDSYSGLHLYVIKLDPKKVSKSRREIYDFMRAANIGVNVHYIPVHLQPYYQNLGFKQGMFPKSEEYYELALTLPLHPDLTDEQLSYIVLSLKEALV